MNNNNFVSEWGLIIVLLIVFWPAGLYLLFRKLNSNRVARLNDGKLLTIGGGILLAVGLLSLLNGPRYVSSFTLLFYLGGGGALIYMGQNMKKVSERYRKYIAIVANQGITDIETIGGMVGQTPQQCHADLQKMIDKGYFHNAYIDQGAGRIVLAVRQPVMPAYAPAPGGGAQPPQPPMGPRVVSCPGCGANNTVMGPGECEYCGGPLS